LTINQNAQQNFNYPIYSIVKEQSCFNVCDKELKQFLILLLIVFLWWR